MAARVANFRSAAADAELQIVGGGLSQFGAATPIAWAILVVLIGVGVQAIADQRAFETRRSDVIALGLVAAAAILNRLVLREFGEGRFEAGLLRLREVLSGDWAGVLPSALLGMVVPLALLWFATGLTTAGAGRLSARRAVRSGDSPDLAGSRIG